MNSNMKRFNLDNYILFVWYDKDRHYPFRTNLYDSKNEVEVHYGEYITIQQLCYMTHKEILIYQECDDAIQLLLDVEKMNDTLDLWLEGLDNFVKESAVSQEKVNVETKLKEVSSEYSVKENHYDYYSSAFKKSGFNDGFNSW